MKITMTFWFILLLSCGATSSRQSQSQSDSQIINRSYNYNSPSNAFVLDAKLEEISSLAYDEVNDVFITNNDEVGRFYILSSEDFSINEQIKFSKKGDYESIEINGDEIFICNSSGTLYSYKLSTKETATYKTELNTANDIEGLCYNRIDHTLLLAGKGIPLGSTYNSKNTKYVYSFDLADKKLNTDPFLIIKHEELIAYVDLNYANESKAKRKQLRKKAKGFAPSGIAIHPITGDYYITSAKGSTILIVGKEKKLKDLIYLNNKIIPQPEGITFDAKANLYISTEGQGLSGKVFKFDYL